MWDEDDLREVIRKVASQRDTFPSFYSNHAERADDPELSRWPFDAMIRGIRLAPRPFRNSFSQRAKTEPATEARQLALRGWLNRFFYAVVRARKGYDQGGNISAETVANLLAQPTNAVLWARQFVAFVQGNGDSAMRTPEEEAELFEKYPELTGALPPSLYSVAEHRHKGRLGEKSLWNSLRHVARDKFRSRQFREEIAHLSSSG